MRDGIDIRLMTSNDIDATCRMASIALYESPEDRERMRSRSPEEVARRKDRHEHLLRHDPQKAWVADDGGRIAGTAIAIVREGFWVLSLFAVDEEYRNAGVGRALLDRALLSAAGTRAAAIVATTHPAALRRYARAGFELHPTLVARGTVSRASLPAGTEVREGTRDDLQLAAEVDLRLRGATHGPDLEFLLQTGCKLSVAERRHGRGYALCWEGSPAVVAATGPEVAVDLLWSCLAQSSGEPVEVRWISGSQNWAVPVVLDAGLSLSPSGPICTRGKTGPLTPYLPSGPFF